MMAKRTRQSSRGWCARTLARSWLLPFCIPCILATACTKDRGDRPLFRLLGPGRTGVTFANTITTNDSVNVQGHFFIYNGAGVAAGDIDNDGLPDLFFSGNQVSSRLYLNRGGMRFEDITRSARVGTDRWAGGATMVDINGDGYLDIYVSVAGLEWTPPEDRANLLFINNGDRTFTEAAAAYGIADTSFTTHAAFLDYDRDGHLDLFLLNNSPEDFARGEAEIHPTGARSMSARSYDQLYRNNGDGTFSNVSRQAGILRQVGYGLGVAVADMNRDGWPDIYVSNDIAPNDVLYINNGDGTFTDRAGVWLRHTSFAGMGADAADFNNDGWPDILQADMAPEALSGRKRISGAMTYGALLESRSKGFRADYSVNTLQLSNGVTADGELVFSEIAALAGVAYSEWSWSSLFGDYDNDGYKDVFITNGYPKATNDFDYQAAMFREKRRGGDPKAAQRRGLEILAQLHGYEVANNVFRNSGDLTFADRTGEWGMNRPSFSYGTAQVDLNTDGRLDLVVSNIDAPAFIYENVGQRNESHHYLRVALKGDAPNVRGTGTELIVTAGGQKQYIYQSPYRGYMSSMEDVAHFGLGRAGRVDSLEVIWPDGRYQLLTDVEVDRRVTVSQTDAADRNSPPSRSIPADRPFQPLSPPRVPSYMHEPQTQVDYGVQPLLPYMVSRQGPPLAVGDVNGDGLDDVFIGGGLDAPGRLYLQKKDGTFAESNQGQPWLGDAAYDDWGAQFFDANGDGRLDLYVSSGGYHLAPRSRLLQDRLYTNEGSGRFVRAGQALPTMLTSTAVVRSGDFTGDGRPDLFVGGRLTPRTYPYPARSYLLRNDGDRFTDVTEEIAPQLASPGGMITDAVWIDLDGDQRLDLVTVGEWMPIQFYRNDGRLLREITQSTRLPQLRGWWFSLAAGDFDNDGRPDLIAGNLGLNHSYTASEKSKFGVYAGNFSGSQTTDVILTKEIDGTEVPFVGLASLGRAIYAIGLRFPTHASFAEASTDQVFGSAELQRALRYQVDTFASVHLRNNGNGTFTVLALPNLAQIAPIRAMVVDDLDGDGHLDLIVAGNLYDMEPNTPPASSGNGLWLKGLGRSDERSHFTPVPPSESGFLAPLNVTGLALINTPNGKAVLIANTGDSLQAFSVRKR
jgi:hypothetical protein